MALRDQFYRYAVPVFCVLGGLIVVFLLNTQTAQAQDYPEWEAQMAAWREANGYDENYNLIADTSGGSNSGGGGTGSGSGGNSGGGSTDAPAQLTWEEQMAAWREANGYDENYNLIADTSGGSNSGGGGTGSGSGGNSGGGSTDAPAQLTWEEQMAAWREANGYDENYNYIGDGSGGTGGGGSDSGSGGSGDGDSDSDPDYVAACTVSNYQSATNYPTANGPVVALGNSLTQGVGATAGEDYVSELERLSGINIINAGISGNTTEDALARLESDVLSRDPSVVLLLIGGNDVLRRYYDNLNEDVVDDSFLDRLIDALLRLFGKMPASTDITEAETFANIETMVDRIHQSGAVVVLIGLDGDPFVTGLSPKYEVIANRTGALFVPDVLDGLVGNPFYMSDLVHPNNRGYDIVASRIYSVFACTQI